MTAPLEKPRHFFPASRAHHAYCMAVDFGMRFCNSRGETHLLEAVTRESQYERFYVHAESVGLLEPMVGDMLNSGEVIQNSIAVATLLDLKRHGVGIIQRNGIPFHWPEEDV